MSRCLSRSSVDFLGVVNKTRAIDAGIERVTTRLNGREVDDSDPDGVFAAGGTIYGMAEESPSTRCWCPS